MEDNKKLDLLCDNIHTEFYNNTNLTEIELKNICEKNNIKIEDYLYLQGYNNFEEYEEDLYIPLF